MKKRDYIYIVTTYCAFTLSILLGLGFIFQAIRIYDKDNLPMYSKDIVSTYLLQLLPLIIIFILIVIFLGIYVVIKNISNKQFVKIFNKERYQTIIKNYDFKQLLENKDFKKEHILRLIIKIINYVVCGSCLLICLIYMFTNNHLNSMEAPTPQIIDLFVHFLPWIGISLISGLICIYVNDYSYLRSINTIKKLRRQHGEKKHRAERSLSKCGSDDETSCDGRGGLRIRPAGTPWHREGYGVQKSRHPLRGGKYPSHRGSKWAGSFRFHIAKSLPWALRALRRGVRCRHRRNAGSHRADPRSAWDAVPELRYHV